MASDSTTSASVQIPGSLIRAFGVFAKGDISLPELLRVISQVLEDNPARGEAVHELLDDELKARRLSISDYGELVGAIGAIVSENVPTEWSEDAPEQPGIYRIAEAGQLIPAKLEGVVAGSAVAANNDAAENRQPMEHTRPFGEDSDSVATANTDTTPELKIEPGLVLRDRFRLEEQVASGGMSVIYRATDLLKKDAGAHDSRVAIKLLAPKYLDDAAVVKSFQGEVSKAQSLAHANIVRLFELDHDGKQYFITMEWLDGESLADYLDRKSGALSEFEAYALIAQLCAALSYAHEHHVVHADVKPGNVFITQTGELKLIDFGVARMAADKGAEGRDAMTPAYASCERIEQSNPTTQDDLYSLACLVYRLLSGSRPYGPLTALEAEQQKADPVPVKGMGDKNWQALRQALAFRRAERPASVKEFAEMLFAEPEPVAVECEVAPIDAEPEFLAADAAIPVDGQVDVLFEDESELEVPEPELTGIFSLDNVGEPGLSEVSRETAADVVAEADEIGSYDLATNPTASDAGQSTLGRLIGLSTRKIQVGGGLAVLLLVGALIIQFTTGDDSTQLPATMIVADEPAVQLPVSPVEPIVEVVIVDEELELSDEFVAAEEPVELVAERIVIEARPYVSGALKVADANLIAEFETESQPLIVGSEAEPAVTDVAAPPLLAVVAAPVVKQPTNVAIPAAPQPATVAQDSPVAVGRPERKVEAATTVAAVATIAAVTAVAEPKAPAKQVEPAAAAPVAPPQPDPVVELNDKAEEALAAGKLIEPADDNVLFYRDAMQAENPDSPMIAGVTAALTVAAIDRATTAANAKDVDTALEWVELAFDNGASSEQLNSLSRRIADLQVEEARVEAAAAAVALAALVPEFDPNQVMPLSELEFIDYVEPRYPRNLSDREYNGWVDLEFRVDTEGRTRGIEVIGSDLPARFESPSLIAVKKWRFKPYIHNGETISVLTAVRLRFEN